MSSSVGPEPVESTRQRILDAALDLFATRGFAATSTRELSERLGFTKAALYYHFHSKDALLQALVDPVMAELTELLERHGSAGGTVGPAGRVGVLEDYLGIILRHRQLVGVLMQDPSAAGRPAMEAGRAFYLRLTELLTGTGDPTVQERARIRFVLGGMHAAVLFAEDGDQLDAVRTGALAAGCAVLGLPAPR
jgi:AcrR family transcriptional regulator